MRIGWFHFQSFVVRFTRLGPSVFSILNQKLITPFVNCSVYVWQASWEFIPSFECLPESGAGFQVDFGVWSSQVSFHPLPLFSSLMESGTLIRGCLVFAWLSREIIGFHLTRMLTWAREFQLRCILYYFYCFLLNSLSSAVIQSRCLDSLGDCSYFQLCLAIRKENELKGQSSSSQYPSPLKKLRSINPKSFWGR